MLQPFGNVTSLGTNVNGPSHDIDPSVSADGLVLFLTDENIPPFRTGGLGAGDIWVATRQTTEDQFGTPINLLKGRVPFPRR